MGEYDGPHLVMTADNTGIRTISYGYNGRDPRLHGADSVAALQRMLELMKRAGKKFSFPIAKSKLAKDEPYDAW